MSLGLFTNPTIFSILGLLGIIIGIPLGFRAKKAEGFAALLGLMIYGVVFVCGFLLLFDRILINFISQKNLIIVQSILILLSVAILMYRNRKIIIRPKIDKIDYILLIGNDSKGLELNSKLRYSFPFNKKLVLSETISVLPMELLLLDRLKFVAPKYWNNYSTTHKIIKGTEVVLFLRGGIKEKKKLVRNSILNDLDNWKKSLTERENR